MWVNLVIVWPACSVQFWTKWQSSIGTVLQRMWLALPCALCWTAWFMWTCRLLYVASCFLLFFPVKFKLCVFLLALVHMFGFSSLFSPPPPPFFFSFLFLLLFVHNCVFSWFYFSFYLAVEPSFRPHLYEKTDCRSGFRLNFLKKPFEGAVAATAVQKQLCSI